MALTDIVVVDAPLSTAQGISGYSWAYTQGFALFGGAAAIPSPLPGIYTGMAGDYGVWWERYDAMEALGYRIWTDDHPASVAYCNALDAESGGYGMGYDPDGNKYAFDTAGNPLKSFSNWDLVARYGYDQRGWDGASRQLNGPGVVDFPQVGDITYPFVALAVRAHNRYKRALQIERGLWFARHGGRPG